MAVRFAIPGGPELVAVLEEGLELFQAPAPTDAALEIFDDWGRMQTAEPAPGEEMDEFGYDSDDHDLSMEGAVPPALAQQEVGLGDEGAMLPDRARLCSKMMAGLQRALDSGALQGVFREIHDEDVAENREFHRLANKNLFGALERALHDGALEGLLAGPLAEDTAAPAAKSFVPCLADLPGVVNTDALEAALRSLATQDDEEN
mmetsp:Transcript_112437/g.314165  ORF Transcript_112437/g.314165 Transcript_112437/m.314165 type:complete len:204 (-) Transcript_112437:108-719(-)